MLVGRGNVFLGSSFLVISGHNLDCASCPLDTYSRKCAWKIISYFSRVLACLMQDRTAPDRSVSWHAVVILSSLALVHSFSNTCKISRLWVRAESDQILFITIWDQSVHIQPQDTKLPTCPSDTPIYVIVPCHPTVTVHKIFKHPGFVSKTNSGHFVKAIFGLIIFMLCL